MSLDEAGMMDVTGIGGVFQAGTSWVRVLISIPTRSRVKVGVLRFDFNYHISQYIFFTWHDD